MDSICIVSSASPEGNVRLNRNLSDRRAETLRNLLLARPDAERHLRGGVTVSSLGSNFPEFLDSVRADGHVPAEAEIADLLENAVDKDAAFRQVMRLHGGVPYSYIRKYILPYLRYAEIIVWSHIREDLPFPQVPGFASAAVSSLPQPGLSGKPVAAQPVPAVKTRPGWYPVLKTNLLYDAVTVVNAEAEFPIGRKVSVAVEDVFPWWSAGPNDRKYCLQLWEMGIEPRWWFRRTDRRDWLSGHFAGVYGMSGKYDFQNDDAICRQGYFWSAGLTYGYSLPVCRFLNMEFSVSAGFLRSHWRYYQPDNRYEHLYEDKDKAGRVSYVGPTKLKVSLVLPLGRDSHNKRRR